MKWLDKHFNKIVILMTIVVILCMLFQNIKNVPSSKQDFGFETNLSSMRWRKANILDRLKMTEEENRRMRLHIDRYQRLFLKQFSDRPTHPDAKSPAYRGKMSLRSCETIHIAIVSAGCNASRSTSTLVKSILFYRKNPIHFHFVTDTIAKMILKKLFSTWKIPKVFVDFYSFEDVTEVVSWIPNKHYSGVFGFLKLTLPGILPESLTKIIVLDTDVVLSSDIAELWSYFEEMPASACLGMTENQSNWYYPGQLWKGHRPWPALGRGFNTGVIIMKLDKLRESDWTQMWKEVAERNLMTEYSTSLADQDIFNALIKEKADIIYKLPCEWNLQLSDNSRANQCLLNQGKFIANVKAIHFNSPLKENAPSVQTNYFRNTLLTFSQYNGNLLRASMLPCYQKEWSPFLRREESFECAELKKTKDTLYRTHLYFLDHSFDVKTSDVTLVAQLSVDRLSMLENLAIHWMGPISLACYLIDAEAQTILEFVQNSNELKKRRNIGFHLVFKEGSLYPINFLRNVALSNVLTDYVFLSDIDFLPGPNVYNSLQRSIRKMDMTRTALIVPAFESHQYRIDKFPKSKAELGQMLDLGTVNTFRHDIWSRGHGATNFARWRNAVKPYHVSWEPDFEPYVVTKANVAPYDTRFSGFGWNKVSHIMLLNAQGYEFIVLPDVFMIHLPHAPSGDVEKFRKDLVYRRCVETLKEEFTKELQTNFSIGNHPKSLQINR